MSLFNILFQIVIFSLNPFLHFAVMLKPWNQPCNCFLSVCFRIFSWCSNKRTRQRKLSDEGLILAHSLISQSVIVENTAGHTETMKKKQRIINTSFSAFAQPRVQTQWMVPPTTEQIKMITPKCGQRLISHVTVDLIKLTTEIIIPFQVILVLNLIQCSVLREGSLNSLQIKLTVE